MKECFLVFAESSYETRDRFLSLVCSGWSLNRAAAEVGMSSPWSVKWWRRLAPMELKPRKGQSGGLALPALLVLPGAASDRPKARRALSLMDRQLIAAGLRLGMTQAAIAKFLGRCKSVISREISRHRGADGNYYAHPVNDFDSQTGVGHAWGEVVVNMLGNTLDLCRTSVR